MLMRVDVFRLCASIAGATICVTIGCSSKSSNATAGASDSGSGSGFEDASFHDEGGGVTKRVDGGRPAMGPMVGQIDGGVQTSLPQVASMTNVIATLNDDSVSITFDPVEGALDYRVYPLPSDGDITVASDGHVVVHNGTYRCAGDREGPAPYLDSAAMTRRRRLTTKVDGRRSAATCARRPTRRWATSPRSRRRASSPCTRSANPTRTPTAHAYFARWDASRAKKYTTSETERTQLLAGLRPRRRHCLLRAGAWVTPRRSRSISTRPAWGRRTCRAITSPTGPEAGAHPASKTPAFPVLANQAPGALPLMRVYYANACGWSHDELAVGQERFNRVYKQGDVQPLVVAPVDWDHRADHARRGSARHRLPVSRSPVAAVDPQRHGNVRHDAAPPPAVHHDRRGARGVADDRSVHQRPAGPAWRGTAGASTEIADARRRASTRAVSPLPKRASQVPNRDGFLRLFLARQRARDVHHRAVRRAATGTATRRGGSSRRRSTRCSSTSSTARRPAPASSRWARPGRAVGHLRRRCGGDTNGKYRLTAKQKASIDARRSCT